MAKARRSKIVALMGSIPTIERTDVRNDYLIGRAAALQGDTETRDKAQRHLTQWATANGVVAGFALAAAGVNAYVSLRNGSPGYGIAAGYDAAVGVLQLGSVYTQLFLRRNLGEMQPDPSFDPSTAPEIRAHASLGELTGTNFAFAALGMTAFTGVSELL